MTTFDEQKVSARVVADSISFGNHRLTTFECVFNRFILPEVNTHRMLSKSAQSSRAIPLGSTEKRIGRLEEVRTTPAFPVFWGENKPGMVADKEIEKVEEARLTWIEAANAAADYAEILMKLKVHKQVASRLLEPFLWQTNVMTSSEPGFRNLLRLRDHPDAQPEFQVLAEKMRIAYEESTPKELSVEDYHLPYISEEELASEPIENLMRASVARVARTSYGSPNGFDLASDLELEARLYNAFPRHDAPFEMVAKPLGAGQSEELGNFPGWRQFRHNLEWRKEL